MFDHRTCGWTGCRFNSEKVPSLELPQCLSNELIPALSSSTTSSVSPTPTTTPTSSGGVTSPTPNNLSTVGAFNGTGIALASESFGSEASGNGTYGLFVLYFQHHTGSIRQMQLRDSGWEGGGQSNIVVPAENVKNGTPISAVSYALNNTAAVSIQRSLKQLDAKIVIVAYILHRP